MSEQKKITNKLFCIILYVIRDIVFLLEMLILDNNWNLIEEENEEFVLAPFTIIVRTERRQTYANYCLAI